MPKAPEPITLTLERKDLIKLSRFLVTLSNLTPAIGKNKAEIGAGMLNGIIEDANELATIFYITPP
jgi:hypothetical protein